MTIKIVAGFAIVFLCTMFGVNYAKKYGRKKDFYASLENFCAYLKREISFSSTPINSVIKGFRPGDDDLVIMLSSFAENGAVPAEKFPRYLTPDERKFLETFFAKIGKSDRQNELELVSSFAEEVRGYKETEKTKCVKITGIAAKLGFFAGAAIFVILL
ncbi:MAG: stage III sporulation protein AB [Clostridia bacterium]|nr:stage III sporulation protein AB [Clostridia bacterium]